MDYYQGYDDAMRQARVTRTTGLAGFLLRAIISLLYSGFIYVPLILLGYWASNKMSALYSNDAFIKVGLTIAWAYLFFALVYMLKGILIGLKNNGQVAWFLFWVICVALTAGTQAVITQNLLESFFNSRHIANYEIWSWIGAASVALLIYSHYQFLTNVAPRTVFWSYRIGFLLSGRKRSAMMPDQKNVALKSSSYFDNAPMKVSFKK
jgi:hypothetical protein